MIAPGKSRVSAATIHQIAWLPENQKLSLPHRKDRHGVALQGSFPVYSKPATEPRARPIPGLSGEVWVIISKIFQAVRPLIPNSKRKAEVSPWFLCNWGLNMAAFLEQPLLVRSGGVQ